MTCRIEKRGGSSRPWRLVLSDGREVYAPQAVAHPHLGTTAVNMPISGKTRAECEAAALDLLERLLLERSAWNQSIPASRSPL
jgi:hypothetical protein